MMKSHLDVTIVHTSKRLAQPVLVPAVRLLLNKVVNYIMRSHLTR
jgi:hypothetical protein